MLLDNMVKLLKSRLMDRRTVLTLCLLAILYVIKQLFGGTQSAEPPVHSRSTYHITRTWDNKDLGHSTTVSLVTHSEGLLVIVDAPFFNDPPNPGGGIGASFPGLWDYEVVEVFFLNDDNKYLEVELCPHGQHLVLLLNGVRKAIKEELPLKFHSAISQKKWHGEAIIPASYFPEKVSKFNAYAIHGSYDQRVYEALYSVQEGKFESPDFHRLEYFQKIDFKTLLPSNMEDTYKSDEGLV